MLVVRTAGYRQSSCARGGPGICCPAAGGPFFFFFDGLHQSVGFIGGADVGDHQTGRAIFEEAVEAVFFLGGRTPHAVDVGGVMTAEHGFDFTGFPGAVFAIEPDAVVVIMRRDGRKEGDGRAGAADAGDFASAELGEDFGASHGVGVEWI